MIHEQLYSTVLPYALSNNTIKHIFSCIKSYMLTLLETSWYICALIEIPPKIPQKRKRNVAKLTSEHANAIVSHCKNLHIDTLQRKSEPHRSGEYDPSSWTVERRVTDSTNISRIFLAGNFAEFSNSVQLLLAHFRIEFIRLCLS